MDMLLPQSPIQQITQAVKPQLSVYKSPKALCSFKEKLLRQFNTQVSAVLKSNLGLCGDCSVHLCRGAEFKGKGGSSTMFAELPESLPRDTVANAN